MNIEDTDNRYTREELSEQSGNDEMMFADGFDNALVGFTTKGCAIYSVNIIIGILMQEGMTEEDSFDHFYFNIDGSYVGEYTPIYMHDCIG